MNNLPKVIRRFLWLKLKEISKGLLIFVGASVILIVATIVVLAILNFVGLGIHLTHILTVTAPKINIYYGAFAVEYMVLGILFFGFLFLVGFIVYAIIWGIKSFICWIMDNWRKATWQIYDEELKKIRKENNK